LVPCTSLVTLCGVVPLIVIFSLGDLAPGEAIPLIVIFGLFGIALIFQGWRGTPQESTPRCARCGYDLRGIVKGARTRCSECGGDLSASDAVQTTTRRRSRKRMTWGLVVIGIPCLMIGWERAMRIVGPDLERLRSTKSLIASIPNEGRGSYQWVELQRRLACGQLNKQEASDAVDQLILTAQKDSRSREEVFSLSGGFLRAAGNAGDISSAQYVAIGQTYYGKTPKLTTPAIVFANQPVGLEIQRANPSWLPGTELGITVRDVAVCNGPTTQPWQGVARRPNPGWFWPRTDELSVSVAPGTYQITFILDMSLLNNGLVTIGAAPKWPALPSLATWTETITRPLQVLPAVAQHVASRP
jgi:hypothetical protein